MCGFTGYTGNIENKEMILRNMMNTIIHRGPDGEGMYMDPDIALGFRRLSIIDLSTAGDQPLYNEDRRMILVFNGEIYNHEILRTELTAKGHVFSSHADSETVLHGYEEWGVQVLEHLRGMYAFAIWDTHRKRLFAARDIFGVKPLYYAQMHDALLFGSEIKSFLEHPDFEKKLNEDCLGNYLSFQFVPSNETFFKNVFYLAPGHYFTYENHKLEIHKYFSPDFTADPGKSFQETVDDIEAVMKDSVQAHMISDVEVGSYLSSGIDSSYLTSLAQVSHTFTVGFDQKHYSEIQDAKKFAESIQVANDSHAIEPDEFWNNLSDILYYMDEPVADPSAVALYFLSAEASKKVKVVLSGEGSDELFGGYNIYCEPLQYTGFNRVPFRIRRLLGIFAEHCLPCGMKGRSFLIRHGKTLEERYFSNATNVFTEHEAARLLKHNNGIGIQKITAPLYKNVRDKDPVTKMQYLDLHLWLAHDILIKSDKMGMANSVEVRVPFLDKEVFKVARKLPLDYKIQAPQTKVALRTAARRRICTQTADKKKLGFPIPIRVWLREDKYYNMVKKAFQSEAAEQFFHTELLLKMLEDHKKGKIRNPKADNSRKIWAVYIFLLWYERFFGTNKPIHPAKEIES